MVFQPSTTRNWPSMNWTSLRYSPWQHDRSLGAWIHGIAEISHEIPGFLMKPWNPLNTVVNING
jgi:hypothetical protein